jgi:hypothetical protein
MRLLLIPGGSCNSTLHTGLDSLHASQRNRLHLITVQRKMMSESVNPSCPELDYSGTLKENNAQWFAIHLVFRKL